ncbi:MAG TPA: SDR family NAD(P)-dependent oxidoreductase [Rubrobacteraceae bacterium]|nr:SDR family NAD(P)-dependent oxidoreductase [Rubrobacteraceae bacterium]
MTDGMALAVKTAVVLGGSGVYGAAVARMLAGEGIRVALGGRSREKLEELEAEIRASGGEALVVGTHLAKRHHAAHLVQAAAESFGGLDVLAFMARVSAPPLARPDLDAWDRSVDVNIKGFLYCLAAALPLMREGGGGHVVSLDASDPRDPIYEAGAEAVRSLLRGLVRELSGEGIRATEVRLGDPRRSDPEACAGAVRRALVEPPGEGVATFTVLEGGSGIEKEVER